MKRMPSSLNAITVALAALSAFSGPAEARDQPGLRACYGVVTFGQENADIRLMQVTTKGQRLPFYKNRTEKTPHCPVEVDGCQLKAFLVPGDLVLAGPDMEDFTCAAYLSTGTKRHRDQVQQTIGFLPRSELKVMAPSPLSSANWSGTWRRPAEAEIRIEPADVGKLNISGNATYGALDPERVKRGAVNVGALEGSIALPKANMIVLGEDYDGSKPPGDDRSECRARLRLFGPYLVVEDSGGCGGHNVSFTGVYVRISPQ